MDFNFLNISLATFNDLPAIVNIYNQTISSRMVTADTNPVTVFDRKEWFYAHTKNRPLWRVKYNDAIIAWVSYQSFYGRPAYDKTAELSIYIDEQFRGKGLGQYLLTYALQQAPKHNIEKILAFIFSHNLPSIKLFEKNQFEIWGHLPEVAEMDSQKYSLSILGKSLR